ncbi:MAG: alpha/beta hydrolase [Acidimicrobiia bacterium]|nr:alpha/beta hydrolase [Acidimicrobiia bacterium]
MAPNRRLIAAAIGGFALWRFFGPEIPPRFRGPQERPTRLTGRTVLSGRHEFFVREAGPEDGPPLVLLHGWVYDGLVTWHRVVPLLARTHRVYVIDLRGHGKSARIRGRVDIEDMADEVAGVMDALGLGSVPVVGYSMGGMIAQELAHRHPGRVDRLVLAATAAQPIAVPSWVAFSAFFVGRGLARLDRVVAPRIAHRYLLAMGVVPPNHSAWLWESLLDRDTDLYYQAGFAILRFDSGEWVGKLTMPTLSIIPTRDQLVLASRQHRTAAALPDNRVVEIEGGRHEAVLTHAEEIAAAIGEFIAP